VHRHPSRRRSRRSVTASCVAVCAAALLLFGSAAAAPEKLSPEQEKALAALAADDVDAYDKALEALAGITDKKALDKIADFGMAAWRPTLTLRAGDLLAGAGADQAAAALTRAKARAGTRWDALARLVQMAERVPGKQGTQYLNDLLGHPNELAAGLAARALAARGDVAARPAIEALLKSGKPGLAASAAHALAKFPADDKLRDTLWARVDNAGKDYVGDHCALALSTMEGAKTYGLRALDLLGGRATSDSFPALTKLALRTIDTIEPAKIQHLLAQKAEKVVEVGCDLAGLTACKDEKVQERLLSIARGEGGWRLRTAAWLALSRTGCEHVESGVSRAILQDGESSYWGIQCAVRRPRETYVAALRDAALDTKDPVRRELAARALNVQPLRDQTRTFLVKKAREGDAKTQASAYLSLGGLQDEATFDLLVAHLAERTDDASRLRIVKGLEKLTGHYYKPDPEVWTQWKKAVEGDIVYVPKKADRRANRADEKSLAERGVTPKTEAAVEQGLAWFAAHQDLDGIWDGARFDEHCPDKDCRQEGGHRDRELAYTGLGCLAFAGAGYDHKAGAYRDVVRRGYEAILARQDFDGSHDDNTWTFSYEAAIVCHALCDGYLLTDDPWLKAGAQRIIDYLVKIQYPGGAWRYHVRSAETDTSVMSWIAMAAVAARTAGVDVPDQVFVCIEAWLDRATDPIPKGEYEIFEPAQFKADNRYGIDVRLDEKGKPRTFKMKTWYQPPRLYTPACTAINLITRIWLGRTRAHPMCLGNANQVISQVPGYNTGLEREFAFYPYSWYYGSLAMYQMGGDYWSQWKTKCIDDVLAHQNKVGHLRGSWTTPRGELAGGLNGGRMFCTAMGIMTLETFYRYAPYLSRHSTRGTDKDERAGKDKGDGGSDAPEEKPPPGPAPK
jgi:hypothetical protein